MMFYWNKITKIFGLLKLLHMKMGINYPLPFTEIVPDTFH